MFPGGFGMGGWWMVFPMIGFIIMIAFMFIMMGRMGFRGPGRDSNRERHENDAPESALEILKKRFAKGEISKEEFEEMKNVL